ncbi:TetR family transcriptional regulator [Actinocorallia herbida]|uniref:TetR family transcriptional regulator n=1 Tax=Actinocorallia herbida TaxID=58109 RepID=A0A3N1CZU8_9ACTN|nr:TetR/AcrR family transcriptional regulator [Actinocorallia herbida]ROO86807.1 TetR family transcriptional regulator [Actinocorallia herbida]
MGGERDEEAFARLRRAALPLFASLGYDGTDTRMIADAAGVPREVVIAAGGRRALYLAIVDTYYREQIAALDEIAEGFTPDEPGVRRLLEGMLEFYLDHIPEISIWQHRYLRDAADLIDIDSAYRQPMFHRIADLLGPEITDRIDVPMVFSIVSWSLRGFLSEGIVRPDGSALGAETPAGQLRFRSYLPHLTSLFFAKDP